MRVRDFCVLALSVVLIALARLSAGSQFPTTGHVTSITYASAGTVFAFTDRGGFYKSWTNGSQWDDLHQSIKSQKDLTDIVFVECDPNEIVAFSSTEMFVTSNALDPDLGTWTPVGLGTETLSLYVSAPNNSQVGFAVSGDFEQCQARVWATENFCGTFSAEPIATSVCQIDWARDSTLLNKPSLYVSKFKATAEDDTVTTHYDFVRSDDLFMTEKSIVSGGKGFHYFAPFMMVATEKQMVTPAGMIWDSFGLSVSHDDGLKLPFDEVEFPFDPADLLGWYVVEETSDAIYVGIHQSEMVPHWGSVFRTDMTYRRLTLIAQMVSRDTTTGELAFYSIADLQGFHLANIVLNPDEVMDQGADPKLGTIMSDDGGQTWKKLQCPDDPLKRLNINLKYEFQFPAPWTSELAPGVIVASGACGDSLPTDPSLLSAVLSRNAGLNGWERLAPTPTGNYAFAMADRGNLMVLGSAAAPGASIVWYSLDFGKTWAQYAACSDPVIYDALSVNSFNDKSFQVIARGRVAGSNDGKLCFADFAPVLAGLPLSPCQGGPDAKMDYEYWNPPHCLLGRRSQFVRRAPSSKCYTSEDYTVRYDYPAHPCECMISDFECDYHFYRSNMSDDTSECVPVSDEYHTGFQSECTSGAWVYYSTGYQLMPGEVCTGGVHDLYQSGMRQCPTTHKFPYWVIWLLLSLLFVGNFCFCGICCIASVTTGLIIILFRLTPPGRFAMKKVRGLGVKGYEKLQSSRGGEEGFDDFSINVGEGEGVAIGTTVEHGDLFGEEGGFGEPVVEKKKKKKKTKGPKVVKPKKQKKGERAALVDDAGLAGIGSFDPNDQSGGNDYIETGDQMPAASQQDPTPFDSIPDDIGYGDVGFDGMDDPDVEVTEEDLI